MSHEGPVTHRGTGHISIGNSGTQTQGDNSPIHNLARQSATAPAESFVERPESPNPDKRRNVFVIHGRDRQATDAIFKLLRTLDLVPLDWE